MAGSVLDNKFRCRDCGATGPGVETAVKSNEPCPACGSSHFERVAVTECCDFCSIPIEGEEFWTHYTRQHAIPLPTGGVQMQSPDWGACEECHRLIEAGDADGLVDRAVNSHAKLHPEIPRNALRASVTVPHTGFWTNIDPDRPPHRGDPSQEETP